MKKTIINFIGTLLGILLYFGIKELFLDLDFEPIWAILLSLGVVFCLVALVSLLYIYLFKKKHK